MSTQAETIEYDYGGVPTLRDFARDNSPIRSIIGPFGSGKSTACGPMEIIRRAQQQQPHADGIRRTRWMVVRNTYKQLEDTTIKTFHEWLPPNYFGDYSKSDHNYTITAFPDCEIEIIFRALDRPDHVRNVLSLEITGAFLNEAREIPWALIGPLFGRTGRYPSKRTGIPCTWRGLFMDSNAPPMNHWMYRVHTGTKLTEHEQKMMQYWKTYNQPGGRDKDAENLDNLPDDYYEMMATMMTEDQVKVYIDNQYGYLKAGKPVYGSWRDRQHSRKNLKPDDAQFTIIRGWDFGLTPAVILSYVAPNGQLRVFKEFTTERAGIGEFAEEVIKWCTLNLKDFKFEDWGDPAGDAGRGTSDKSGFEVLEGLGVMIQGASNDPMIRLESVRYGLKTLIDGEAAIVVDKDECMVLTEGFQGGYEYRRIITSADERYSEAEPNKNSYSHPHDAFQYIAQKVFGDMVLYNQESIDDLRDIGQRRQIVDEDYPDYDNDDIEMQTEQIT